MKLRYLILVAFVGVSLAYLPSLRAGGDQVYQVGKAGLKIKGRVAESDAKFKLTPLPNQQEVQLPGKMFQVKLMGGKRYRIALISNEIDSVLMVKDDSDKQLAWDDDRAGGLNALVMFDPAKDATYKIYAMSLKGKGAFTLQIREAVVHEVGGGLTLRGSLGRAKAPRFAYNVKLAAGKTYVIDMISPNQKALDPYLILLNPSGKKGHFSLKLHRRPLFSRPALVPGAAAAPWALGCGG